MSWYPQNCMLLMKYLPLYWAGLRNLVINMQRHFIMKTFATNFEQLSKNLINITKNCHALHVHDTDVKNLFLFISEAYWYRVNTLNLILYDTCQHVSMSLKGNLLELLSWIRTEYYFISSYIKLKIVTYSLWMTKIGETQT